MNATEAFDASTRVVRAEQQTLITNVRQKLHSEESYEIKALIQQAPFIPHMPKNKICFNS